MISIRDLVSALQELGLPAGRPVIAHASLSAFGQVEGGAAALLEALLGQYPSLVMPAFTYKTMVFPELGPPDNAAAYGSYREANLMAQFFRPSMPVDRLMGATAEALRCHFSARRSMHPILSFVGVNAEQALACQTLLEPLAPVGWLTQAGGWVLLLGVDQMVNTSIHYAERLAGRKQFIRWALTPQGVVQCPAFPGCSDGFNAITRRIASHTHSAWVGEAWIQAIPLADLVSVARSMVEADPLALLCDHTYCERCSVIRGLVERAGQSDR
jgi:aminoglycoside 3-N-acetyltransferase